MVDFKMIGRTSIHINIIDEELNKYKQFIYIF